MVQRHDGLTMMNRPMAFDDDPVAQVWPRYGPGVYQLRPSCGSGVAQLEGSEAADGLN